MATGFGGEGWRSWGQVERGNQTVDDLSQLCALQENSQPFTAAKQVSTKCLTSHEIRKN